MIKRFLKLDFSSWKERKLKGTYLRYYIQNPEDDRNILARWLDFLAIIFVTWALSFILLAEITRTSKALLLSPVLLVVGLTVTDIIKRKQLRKKLLNTRRELAKESYLEELGRMENGEFVNFSTGLLKKYGIRFDHDDIPKRSDGEVLAGTFEQGPVGIIFFTREGSATPAAVEELVDKFFAGNYTAGIIVAREKKSSELEQAVKLYREKMHIELLDQNRLAILAAHLEHATSSSLAEDFSQLKQHQEKSKRQLLRKELIGSRQKTKGYAFSAVLLFVSFAFWPSSTALSLIYLLFGLVNTALAATSFIMERQKTRAQLLKP